MAPDDDRTRVFLSYSRKDHAFVAWLAAALDDRQCLCDFDRSAGDPDNVVTGIAAEDAWWTRLQDMLAAAEVVVFVVSPDAIRSKVCDDEIAHAQGLGKRLIPVLCRDVEFARLPPRLSALNIKISFTAGDAESRAESVQALAAAIRRDVHWLRTAARVAQAATRWEAASRPQDMLVRGSELGGFEDWAARRPSTAPDHPPLVLAYLAASRQAEGERRTIGEIERARYLELVSVMRPFLEEELRLRENQPRSTHPGVQGEQDVEALYVRNLLTLQNRWHPEPAVHLRSMGADAGYAELFRFPCCSAHVRDFRSTGEGDPPSQFRVDGCQEIPEAIRHEYRSRSNPFHSVLVWRSRQMAGPGSDDAGPAPA